MLIKTKGIILRTVKYSETSLIADIYTEEKGLRTYIISGVRTPKSKVSPGLIQVMSLVDMVCYEKEDAHKLNRIKEIRPAYIYSDLLFDVPKSSVGLFMAEVVRRTIKEAESNADLFHFLFDIFVFLDETKVSFSNLHLSFMVHFAAFLGFEPHDIDDIFNKNTNGDIVFDLQEGVFTDKIIGHSYFLSAHLSKILREVLQHDWRESHLIKISRDDRKQLLSELITFYRLHIEHMPEINSYKILQEIF
jgi:DNA repair protein RecO (recombination protein O)